MPSKNYVYNLGPFILSLSRTCYCPRHAKVDSFNSLYKLEGHVQGGATKLPSLTQ